MYFLSATDYFGGYLRFVEFGVNRVAHIIDSVPHYNRFKLY